MNLVLIGYRGSGKTSVARLLGLALGWDWIDADVEIELAAGKSIREIFSDAGEDAFRDLETRVLADLAGRDNVVLALGGGAIARANNRALIAKRGKVVWLQAAPKTLWQRIADDPATAARRPNLTADGGLAEVARMLADREPAYRQCADLEIDTEGKSPAEVAAEIAARLDLPTTREDLA